MADEGAILFQCRQTAHGYTMRIFLTASALNGFDPEQFSRWGIHYLVRDNELGEQTLSVGSDFPYTDDPSLWSVLELKQTEKKAKPTGRKPVEEE